jgi:hypothetical protein
MHVPASKNNPTIKKKCTHAPNLIDIYPCSFHILLFGNRSRKEPVNAMFIPNSLAFTIFSRYQSQLLDLGNLS